MSTDKVIMGLDIGSASVKAAIGTLSSDGTLTVESLCERESSGMYNGSVVNAESVFKTIKSVISEAELQSGLQAGSVSVGVGGNGVTCRQGEGVTGIGARGQEITRADIYKSLEIARTLSLEPDSSIIHTLVQDFTVDGRRGIKDPLDMTGHRLESRALIVTASTNNCGNLRKVVEKAGIGNVHICSSILSDAESVLSIDDKEMGTLLVNIGADTTDLIAYIKGSPVYIGAVNFGGRAVTNDIVSITSKPKQVIEELKCQHGSCYSPGIDPKEKIIIPKVSGTAAIELPRVEFAKMIEARMAEIFMMLEVNKRNSGIGGPFGGGVVLTGGGALLSGTTNLASEIFGLQARIGFPEMIKGLDRLYIGPEYTTVLGLLKMEAKKGALPKGRTESSRSSQRQDGGLLHKIGNFFKTVV